MNTHTRTRTLAVPLTLAAATASGSCTQQPAYKAEGHVYVGSDRELVPETKAADDTREQRDTTTPAD